ncbi:MAG: STAS-like domain-containing protein, partial [Microbacteriaceae bacterium]|nr:STAS-like domain-containing protein [Burkholderiaceae bacterium]
QGSSIYMAIALDTKRTLDQVLEAWSLDGTGIEFDQTVIALRLLAGPGQPLDTRAQARRVVARLPTFKRVEISFEGMADVGHGFVDELFRVFGRAHPEVELVPTAMTARTAALIRSARAA